MYMHACMYVPMYVSMYVCMYVCLYACMHGCMDVWMYGCMDVCMYVMYAHTHITYIYIYDPGSAVPPPLPPPQWFPPTAPLLLWVASLPPLWCGVVWLWVASRLPVVWCGSGVGFGGSPPSTPVAWCGLGGSPLHVWICLGCLVNPCS